MIKLEKANGNIIQSKSDTSTDNYVGLVVRIDGAGKAIHAGILINYLSKRLVLHFMPTDLGLRAVPNEWYFHKRLSLISPRFVLSFKSYCERVVDNANPKWGKVYSGCLYNDKGEYFSDTDAPEIMTCVGFCISVLKGFLKAEEYFQYVDWNVNTVDDEYIEEFIYEFSKIHSTEQMEILKQHIRRISPSDYFTSAFLPKRLPIKKESIDKYRPVIEQALVGRAETI